jgi:hypothetical protein
MTLDPVDIDSDRPAITRRSSYAWPRRWKRVDGQRTLGVLRDPLD